MALRFIIALGIISLLADVTYEGARGVNGPFLGTLGAGAAMVAIISGAGELVGYTLRLFSGFATDRTRAYWTWTIIGYAINLLAVPCLAFAHHWGFAAALIIAERAGKAIRTPARDVMLSQAAAVVGRGRAFGLHEFLDQLGAFLGPLVVAWVLAESHQYYRAYALLAIPAGLAITALLAAIRLYPDPSRFEPPASSPSLEAGARLPRDFWLYVAASGLLAAGFVDFPLLGYHFQKTGLASPAVISVFYSAAMGVEALSALGFGHWFDRIGTPVLILGVLLSAASSPLAFFGSAPVALAGVALWGAGRGAQQSTLRARIAEMVPVERRGSAYGIFNSVYGLLWFAGSSAIGVLYGRSLAGAAAFAVLTQLAAIPLLWMVRRNRT